MTMELDRLIIRKLLGKYESSAHFRTAAKSGRRVLLKLGPRSRDLPAYDIENPEQKEAVHAGIARLKAAGLVDFSWERFNAGNVMAEAWLNLEQIDVAYAFAGLTPKRGIVDAMLTEIQALTDRLDGMPASASDGGGGASAGADNRVWVLPALRDMANRIANSHKWTPALPENPDLARNFLTVLSALAQPDFVPTHLRIFSIQCFRDSKYLERFFLTRLISLVRKFHPLYKSLEYGEPGEDRTTLPHNNPETTGCMGSVESFAEAEAGGLFAEAEAGELTIEDEISAPDDMLSLIGLSRNPEIFEFCGPIKLTFTAPDSADRDTGDPFDRKPITFDYAALPQGACLASSSVDRIVAVETPTVRRLLFIENRTNYEACIRNRPGQVIGNQELLIYHGGFHGPVRLQFFGKLVAALPPDAAIFHWGDIDLGGIRIFLQIRNDIASGLQPWRMDAQTLLENRARALPFSQPYRAALKKAYDDPAFGMFREVIAAMLASGLRLEQEALIQ